MLMLSETQHQRHLSIN